MAHRLLTAAFLAVLVTSVVLIPRPAKAAPPSESYSATVNATTIDWLDTGISLKPGDKVRITSDPADTWCWGDPFFGAEACTDANGVVGRPNEEEQPTTLFPDGHFGQIYARVGGQAFPGSVDFSFMVKERGTLELVMNERIGFLFDNSGSIDFTITVTGSNGGSTELPPNAAYMQDLAEVWKMVNQVVQATNRVCQHLECDKLAKPARAADQSLTIGNLFAAIPLSAQLGDDLKAMNETLAKNGKDSLEYCLAGQQTYGTARHLHETLVDLVLGLELIFPVPPAGSGPTC